MEVNSNDGAVPAPPAETAAAAATAQEGSELELDQNLWPHLPEALVPTVLRFLPAESVFKFRSVCKKWLTILTDPTFLESRSGAPHRSPFCVLADFANNRIVVYNIASEKWYFPSGDDLLTGPFPTHRTVLLAAAAGLVLLEFLPESGGLGRKSLLLVNPVNRSYRQVPDLEFENSDEDGDDGDEVRRAKLVGMDYNPQSGSFQILTRSSLFHVEDLDNPRPPISIQFHVYDLKTDSWTMYDSSEEEGPPEWDNNYRVQGTAVLHGGFWYYLAYVRRYWDARNRHGTPHVFRVKEGVAEAVQAPFPQETGRIVNFLHVFVCQGKVVLAGSVKTKDNLIVNEWVSFRFWQLDEEKSEWVDYLRMPDYLVNHLSNRRAKRFALDLDCSVDGDNICFWVGRPAGKDYRTIEMVIYSISKEIWWAVNSDVDMPRARFYGWNCFNSVTGLHNKPFPYFLFKPNLNLTL